MFLKLWLLICATQLVIINGTYDSAYGGIKTKPYQRGYPNPEEHHHHHSPTDELYPNPSTYDIRASSSGYDNLNKGDTSARLSPSDAHQHYVVPGNQQTLSHKQQQHQYQQQRSTPQADAYQQRKLPIYDRNAHVRHTPTVTGAWSVGAAPNTITDFPTGCPPGHTGPVPYAYDCRRFVNCWHGRGHIQSCGPGTVFNPETLECDRPDKVVCGGSPNAKDIGDKELNEKQIMPRNEPKQNEYRDGRLLDANNDNVQTLCPVGVDGLAPHPNDCTKFLNCANGKTHVQSCGPGTAFSISMKVCDFKEKVDCIGRDGGVGSLSSRDARKYDPPNYQDRNLGGNALQSYEDENNIFCLPGLSGLFPYPFDYTKFLNCKSGNTAIQNCMPGTVFSVSRNYCDEKEKVPYSDHIPYTVSEAGYEFSLSMINCPPSTDGIHLYPYGPTKYINCQRGQMTVIACPPNTQFCLSTKTCRPEYEVVTGDRVRNAVELNSNADNRDSRHSDLQYLDQLFECPKDQSALYPHPFDCNKYLQCRNGRLTIETCRPGYVFSLSAKHCDPKALVGAKQQVQFELDDGQNRQSESGYDYRTIQLTCPPNVNGYFLHPFDCTKYLLCHDGQSLVEACKSGKVFSISRRQCINRNQVDAYDRVEYQSEVKHEFSSPGLEKMCLRAASGFHPHPTDNTKYVKCTNGLAMIESCLEGLIFSKARKHCDYESKVFEYDRDYSGFIGGNESEFKTQSKVYTDEINSDGYDNWKAFIGGEASRDFYNERAPVNADSGAPVQCPANVEGMYPHPLDCQKFLICSNGITHIKDCALGTAWNVEMEVCDFENNVKCAQHPKPPSSKIGHVISDNKIECPPNAKGRYLHPFDPRKYINCNEEGTRIQNCPSGSVFSISRSMCLVEEEVNTVDFVQCTQDYSMELSPTYYNYVACPPAALGYFIYPFDGLLFISCHNGQTMIQNCSPQTLFSISNKICIPINEAESNDHLWLGSDREDANLKSYGVYDGAGSTIIPTSGSTHTLTSAQTLSSPVCPGDDGLYPHPTDCTQFLRCANGISYVQQCGPGTAFNAALEVCDLKNRVDCSGRESLAAGENRDVSSYSVACPSGVSGVYPHPFDCKKFLNCNNGIENIQDCGAGTAWNAKIEVCDFIERVDCSNNGGLVAGEPKANTGYGHNINANLQPPALPSQPFYIGSTTSQSNWPQDGREAPTPFQRETPYGNPNINSNLPTPTPPRAYGDRWSNMNRQRPLASDSIYTPDSLDRQRPLTSDSVYVPERTHSSGYDRPPHRTSPSWTGTGSSTSGQTPAHTTIYEEGSLVPNRNYNTINTITSPLAPFHSDSTFDSSVKTQTFTNATTNIYFAEPVGSEENSDEVFDGNESETNNKVPTKQWIPIPNQELLPPKRSNDQPGNNQYGAATLPTRLTLSPHPSQTTLPPLNNFDSSNLYGGLQPPPPPATPQNALPHASTKNTPSHSILPQSARPSGRSIDNIEPIRAFSTNTNGQPHLLSSPSNTNLYQTNSLTSTPATYLQPPTMPTPAARTHTTASTRLKQVPHPLLEHTTMATFSKDPHYSNSYSNVAHVKPVQSAEPQDFQSPDDLAMNEALRLLLRPYFNRSGTISDERADKAQSHIMSLTPHLTHSPTNSTASSQNDKNPTTDPHNETEVELILAGEQHSLTTNPTQTSHYPDPSKELYSKNTKHESKTNTNWQTNGHNPEFHRSHPNLLNPFAGDEYSSPHNHHNHHNQLHNKAFHQRHPEMPSPFVAPTIPPATHEPATEREIPQNPRAESTTPFSVRPEIDLRSGFDCQFDCGNGKCVKSFEVCNGINNCGNRKDEEDCKHLGYEVRLAGGESPNMGRIEVKILGKWGYICDDKFGLRDAEVVCRELGFKLGASEVRGYSYYPPTTSDVSFVMDEVDCRGDESSLKDCNFKGWGVSNCGPDEVVGVVCKVPQLKCPNNYWLCTTSQECIPPAFVCDHTPDCADKSDESPNVCNSPVKYRMGGGRSPNEGRLEVRYHGEWGTVCDDDFGMKEAQVLCNYMGFYGLPHIEKNKYGPGAGPIWLDQVSCFGNETSLDQCNHWTWGEHNCNHTEDVGLKCTVGAPPKKRTQAASQKLNTDENAQKDLDDAQQELEDIGLFPDEWERKSKAVGTQRRCGHFKDNINDEYAHPEERVVNGSTAKRGHHPWQATIRTRGRGGISSHWCGAVLISSRHLLTAAHCLAGYPKGAYLIRLGDHYANIAESSEIDSFIENWYVHEKFRDATHMNNDIALIVLKTPVKFNDYIQPVCLPLKGATLTENRKCTISGWGSIKSGVSTPSNILRAAELPILSNEVCKQPHVYGASLTEGMFCAGYMDESVDACDGDSGGPLICHDEDGETLYGIISWGQHCGYANKPGVYVRVEKYVDWILEKINFSIQNTS
ncbi:uncharacterized protein teq isoform X2 [Eurosta solidaginis]|uniref:uncharacterized protein teq isoform X2 n=1 Tax=Eurosta solidaginis TaxID=178769 RepID=UPI00353087E1